MELSADSRVRANRSRPSGSRLSFVVAVEAVRRGAYDYPRKPFRIDEMEIAIRRAREKRRLVAELEVARLKQAVGRHLHG